MDYVRDGERYQARFYRADESFFDSDWYVVDETRPYHEIDIRWGAGRGARDNTRTPSPWRQATRGHIRKQRWR